MAPRSQSWLEVDHSLPPSRCWEIDLQQRCALALVCRRWPSSTSPDTSEAGTQGSPEPAERRLAAGVGQGRLDVGQQLAVRRPGGGEADRRARLARGGPLRAVLQATGGSGPLHVDAPGTGEQPNVPRSHVSTCLPIPYLRPASAADETRGQAAGRGGGNGVGLSFGQGVADEVGHVPGAVHELEGRTVQAVDGPPR
jgi:hypothetical protein